MKRVLRKRLPRDIKENFPRYLALYLMIAVAMYLIISIVGAADTIINGTVSKANANLVEDGHFTTFIPLEAYQEELLTNSGAIVERMFSADAEMPDGSVLRVFGERKTINLPHIDKGEKADNMGEAVLEKRYAETHGISVGDTIELFGKNLTVTGIGCVPEYDMPLAETSDMVVDSSLFGIAIVTDEQYNKLVNDNVTENYCYAYRLNNSLTHNELKEMIKELEFDYNKVNNIYFREMTDNILSDKEKLQDGINEIYDGSKELTEGLSELESAGDSIQSGTDEVFSLYLSQVNSVISQMGFTETLTKDNYSEILDNYAAMTGSEEIAALKKALDGLNEYYDGITEYIDGADKAYDGSKKLSNGISELKSETDEFLDEVFELDIANLTEFTEAQNDPRIFAAANDLITNKKIGLLAGVVIMILFTYVISVFVIHKVQSESSIIGTLYALGAKKSDLISHYITIPTIISLAGGITGLLLGFSEIGIPIQMKDTYNYFSVPHLEPSKPLYLMIYAVIMPPVVSMLVNRLVISKKLSKSALSLIRNEQTTDIRGRINIRKLSFINKFRIRQTLREIRTGLTVIFAMLVCLLIFMLGMNCYTVCNNIRNDNVEYTKYEYMYTLKYPAENPPENSEPCYIESLSKTNMGFTVDITVIGIDDTNRYYDTIPVKGRNKLVISTSAAQKYSLKKGDTFVLTDNAEDMSYAFEVADISPYSAGLAVFMDIDSMRELFGQEDDYYNMLLSEEALDIESGRIYSVTEKSEIIRSSGIFVDQMRGMYTMLISLSAVIFCAVMYLMLNVMTDRASFGISLVKIFGFRNKELKKLYLSGNTFIIAIGALITIPLSKLIMNTLFPSFVANTACGVNLKFPTYLYAVIFAAIMLIYFAVNFVLTIKLNKITPAQVLKNRE